MRIVRLGKHYPDPLTLPVTVNPLNRARNVPLKRLDYLLGMLSNHNLFATYVQNLTKKYESMTHRNPIKASGIDIGSVTREFPNINPFSELITSYLNYFLELLTVSPIFFEKETTVENREYLKAFLYPDYYNLLVLTETFGRATGIGLWKRYITQYVIDNRIQRNLGDVQEIFERRNKGNQDSEWVIVHAVIAEGKYAYKNENCTWVDVMESLPDSELKYYVCCYGDYEKARTNDENLMLTMEHTIAEGDPYCSRVLHDVRVDWKLDHPSKEFWDNFIPKD